MAPAWLGWVLLGIGIPTFLAGAYILFTSGGEPTQQVRGWTVMIVGTVLDIAGALARASQQRRP